MEYEIECSLWKTGYKDGRTCHILQSWTNVAEIRCLKKLKVTSAWPSLSTPTWNSTSANVPVKGLLRALQTTKCKTQSHKPREKKSCFHCFSPQDSCVWERNVNCASAFSPGRSWNHTQTDSLTHLHTHVLRTITLTCTNEIHEHCRTF